ncbi:MAG TPA: hypothetical protein VFV31_03735 [Chitinophagaceae bacterium]|nr:hypothetical protein [Chitinophagaceae bacterium]
MIYIDWNKVDELLEAGCDGTQIAAYLGCHPETLYDRCKNEQKADFSDYKAQKRAKGDSALLTAQFDAAVKDKDRAMLIWLGKQRLGQADKQQLEHLGNQEAPVIFKLDERFRTKGS